MVDSHHTISIFGRNKQEEFIYYLVINIPGMELNKGDLLVDYSPPDLNATDYQADLYQQFHFESGDLNQILNQLSINNFHLEDRIRFYLSEPQTLVITNRKRWSSSSTNHFPALQSENGQLPEKEAKYCRCVLHVASQQPTECLRQKSWFKQINGKICTTNRRLVARHLWGDGTNPYAVCAESVGETSQRCGAYYNYDQLPDEELIGYAHLNKIEVPYPYNRNEILKRIFDWKRQRYAQRYAQE